MGQGSKGGLEAQLRRQCLWLKEAWLWLLRTKVLGSDPEKARPKALDVGCGPGFVMDVLKEEMGVVGIDKDPDMVSMGKAKGFDVQKGDARDLPFEDGSFDIVYCSFLLLWVKEPAQVVKEMVRVSRQWVLCLAEPDFGARIDHPKELSELNDIVVNGITADGGDPHIGRKLRAIFQQSGLDVEVGVHAGVWDTERLRKEFEDDWRWLEMTAGDVDKEKLDQLRLSWKQALEKGTLFQYNPIFYALGRLS